MLMARVKYPTDVTEHHTYSTINKYNTCYNSEGKATQSTDNGIRLSKVIKWQKSDKHSVRMLSMVKQ